VIETLRFKSPSVVKVHKLGAVGITSILSSILV